MLPSGTMNWMTAGSTGANVKVRGPGAADGEVNEDPPLLQPAASRVRRIAARLVSIQFG